MRTIKATLELIHNSLFDRKMLGAPAPQNRSVLGVREDSRSEATTQLPAKMGYAKATLCIMMVLTLQSCSNMNKQQGGTILGGITGGLLGSQFGKGSGQLAAVGVGALVGALIGSEIGKSMDEQDKMLAERASQQALEYTPSGNRVKWKNPDNGHSGFVTPTRTYQDESSGQYCREYTHEIMIDGEKEKAYGKACRKPDGHWRIMD